MLNYVIVVTVVVSLNLPLIRGFVKAKKYPPIGGTGGYFHYRLDVWRVMRYCSFTTKLRDIVNHTFHVVSRSKDVHGIKSTGDYPS